ncbi:polymorphic toxin-type HINT domain-containing protein [Streptomyces sp. NBC_01142]|uniref:polymorphic toxin-type HINT domain-containing protein n=1 Tax=Streptomyces sp. NBC_01142 TaxID=2975865 RepID=UPI0022524535|nr:polymorphic toxin-type HINT domain-containing protein [Streptomyces sp. NBC_01142]MCX4819014.1 polymorphic toxin-type HINT domain-containing protein [Streptomyces sp. NBC_01142]
MVATLLQAVAFESTASAIGKGLPGLPGLPSAEKPVAGSSSNRMTPRRVEKGPRTPKEDPKATWPKAGSAVVRLDDPATKASDPVKAKGLPVEVTTPPKQRLKRAVLRSVETRVLPRAAAKKAGVDGLLFTLEPQADSAAGSVGASVDYSAFAESFGGGYGSRLTLVELPACALSKPTEAKCRTATPVATDNNVEKQTLTARAVTLKAGTPTLLAAVAGDVGKMGDYKATPLAASSTWNTDLSSGDFGWSYDIPVPEVPGEMAPEVGLSYSSGAIDGRTGGTNNQSSWAGDGFDLWPGYIERRYKPCADDGVKDADGNKPGDLCWGYDNAFITFNGKGGELVPAGDDEFKLKKDDGTRIKRLASTARGNGDNDGEYWRLTDPSGNSYYFGYNRLPGWADGKESTDSTWTAPVYGDDSGEKCHASTFAGSWCQQAWRWNLDYAVDTHGNAIAYYYDKEENSYGRNLKAADNTRYTRGGYLDRIEYGLKSDSVYKTKALAKVDFTSSERCIADSQTTCSSIDTDSFHWYDTPWDMNCTASEDCDKGRLAATFWTRKRLTGITTQVLNGGAYSKVDSWALGHRWGKADIDYQLLLDSIQRTGHSATTPVTLPKTTLAYTQLANRMDKTGDGYAPFIKSRLSTVADEHGGQIDVNYSGQACNAGSLPTPESNTTRCFPQMLGGSDTEPAEQHWFNKYVVTSVTATDRTGKAPDAVTAYEYVGGAAWHYDDDDGLTKEKEKTWSQWRGYEQVRVKAGGQGGASALKSQRDTYFLRGMDGDRKGKSGGTKSVTVALGEGEGDPITDHESAAGFAYRTATYSGPGGKILEKTVERPWHHETAKKVRAWGTVTANFTGTESSKTYTSLDNGAGTSWRTTSKTTGYDNATGRAFELDDRGDNSTAADDQCTRTSYTTNSTADILPLPSRVETVAVDCDTTPDRTKHVISDVRTAYDGGAYGAAPTKGDTSATATLKKHDGTTATYLESATAVDAYGRTLTSTDLSANVTVTGAGTPARTPRTDGRTTTTKFEPTSGFPTKITTTSPPAKAPDAATAQTTVVTLDPLRGKTLTETDTNNRVTTLAYDALGRSSKIWLANRATSLTPSYAFDYFIDEGKEVAVRSQTLDNSGAQLASYTILDGFLRERQTQAPGPGGGRLLTDNFYDERGQVAKTFATYYTEGAPNRQLFLPENALSVETQTRHSFDGLGRETEAKQLAGNGDGGTVLGVTQTIHGGDHTTVIPPEGGTATTTLTDARGQTTQLRQHHSRNAAAPYDTTTYTHTPAGKLAKVTDPEGNDWTYAYDQLGRQTTTKDPDKGSITSTYDDRGQLVTTTDARNTLHHVYDGLGRQTQLRDGSATGTLRAEWTYDTVTGAKGQLASATRHVNGSPYTTKVTQYDQLYRPMRTAVVIPASEGDLAGTYQTGTSYKTSGLIAGVSYSAAGSLPGGSYAYNYDDILRPVSVLGDGFKADTSYSLTGKPLQYQYASTADGAKKAQVTNTYEWGTQHLATSRVDREGVAGVDRHNTYRYDQAGNVLAIADASRDGADTQCFTYDYLRRLTSAWTEGDATCSTTASGSAIGGVAPYWHSYTYDKTGNRLTETLHDTAGDTAKDTKRAYSYPPAGSSRPHGLTQVAQSGPSGTSKTTYGYDATGNTHSRVNPGDTQKLAWDAEGHLAKVTKSVEGKPDDVTEYLYDTEGNRLIARTAAETTLYLGHTELVLPKGATKAKATRYIDLGSGSQAVQADDRKVTITVADHQATGQLAITADSLALTQRRSLPFGGTRGTTPEAWAGTKGFVGGTDDTGTTGLTHLGAREYDSTIGRFLSVDPLMDLADPQHLNGYTYSENNPVTYSDPTGLRKADCEGGWGKCGPGPKVAGSADSGGKSKGRTRGSSDNGNGGKITVTVKVTAQAPDCPYSGHLADACHVSETMFKAGYIRSEGQVSAWEITKTLILPDTKAWSECLNGESLESCAWAATDLPTPGKILKIVKLTKLKKTKKVTSECQCFLAGTDVLMADGSTKNIEEVELGDKVLATDPKTGETGEREVTATIVTDDDKYFTDLTISTPVGTEHLTATYEHPFWAVSEQDWIEAGDLKPGMTLRTDDGRTVKVTATRQFQDHARTYNLTIADLHTYYVLAGATPVLVHNCDRAGLDFTDAERQKVYDANEAKNDSVLKCDYCGRDVVRRPSTRGVPGRPDDAQIDHIEPRAGGGHGGAHNGAVACRRCNRDKSTKPLEDWDDELREFLEP